MYNILIIDNEISTKNLLEERLKSLKHQVMIFFTKSFQDAQHIIATCKINFFIINIFDDNQASMNLASKIYLKEKYTFTPIVFIASKIDYIITAYKNINCLDYQVKPLDLHSFCKTFNFINTHIEITLKMFNTEVKSLQFSSGHSLNRVLLQNILFIESFERKCTLHTYDEQIVINRPLKNILLDLKETPLIKTHRSFIVNTINIKYIDKHSDPWTIFFNDYCKTALVSRNFRDTLIKELQGCDYT